MANPFAPAQIDFSSLAQMGQNVGGAIGQYNLGSAMSGAIKPDGSFDYDKGMAILAERQPLAAMKWASGFGQGGANVYGTPIYGQDEQGNTVLGVIGKDGSFRQLDTGGVTPTPGVTFQNLGTSVQPFSSKTGAPVAQPTPIDVSGEKGAAVQGESAAKAQVNMPLVENATRRIISTIEAIEQSPGLSRATGPLQSKLPTVTGEVADVEAKVEQATSGAFLQMYEQLRGGGAITEAEGAKASGALGRVGDLKQSDPGYKQALREAKFEVLELLNVARRKAGMQPVPNPYAGRSNTTSMSRAAPLPAQPSVQAGTTDVYSSGGGARPIPTPQQIELLRQHANNPEAVQTFEEFYGAGSADWFLRGGR